MERSKYNLMNLMKKIFLDLGFVEILEILNRINILKIPTNPKHPGQKDLLV